MKKRLTETGRYTDYVLLASSGVTAFLAAAPIGPNPTPSTPNPKPQTINPKP